VTLRAGTVSTFATGSLAEAIESAFASELRASKGQALPDIAVEDRRLLFAAIAQGFLAYLARNDADLKVNVNPGTGTPVSRAVDVGAPTLTASGGTVSGAGWPNGAVVTLRWAGTGAVAGTRTASGGTFSISVPVPAGGDVLGARDTGGNAAAVRVG
jgi:hypothetical protein